MDRRGLTAKGPMRVIGIVAPYVGMEFEAEEYVLRFAVPEEGKLMGQDKTQDRTAPRWLEGKLRRFNNTLDRLFPRRVEKRFVKQWTQVLTTDAKLYNGLFSGLRRAADGKAKQPQKVLNEWYDRTRYKWEDGEITRLSAATLKPAADRAVAEECAQWAALLLEASGGGGECPGSGGRMKFLTYIRVGLPWPCFLRSISPMSSNSLKWRTALL